MKAHQSTMFDVNVQLRQSIVNIIHTFLVPIQYLQHNNMYISTYLPIIKKNSRLG